MKNCLFKNNYNHSTIRGNRGGGLYIDGNRTDTGLITITDCIFENNTADYGGGLYLFLYNKQEAIVDRCISRNNTCLLDNARSGGIEFDSGIFTNSTSHTYHMSGTKIETKFTLTNSSVYNNYSSMIGGGVILGGAGKIDVINCTIANNKTDGSGGGIFTNNSTVKMVNCTIFGNTAKNVSGGIGVHPDGHNLSLYNCIIANNKALNKGSITTVKNNCSCTFGGSNNIEYPTISSSSLDSFCAPNIKVTNPKLGTLGDFGGATFTIPLLAGSPAINAGRSDMGITTDQRGFIRDSKYDIGAFEFASLSSPVNTGFSTIIYEAEDHYSVVQDTSSRTISKIGGDDILSANNSVVMHDYGDKIKIKFNIQSASQFILKLKLRSGNSGNPTQFFNNYSFGLDGSNISLTGDGASVSGLSSRYGGSYWGFVVSSPVNLAAGQHELSIEAKRDWLGVDFLLLSDISTPSAIYEAEDHYIVVKDIPGKSISEMQGEDVLGSGSSVALHDNGDKIKIMFDIASTSQYILKVRLRSGNSSDPTQFFNKYSFNLNGSNIDLYGDVSSATDFSTSYGGSYWGLAVSTPVNLAAGKHELSIQANRDWLGVDYLELSNYISNSLTIANVNQELFVDEDESGLAIKRIYGNPIKNDKIKIAFTGKIKGSIRYQMVDYLGRTIIQNDLNGIEGQDYIELDTPVNLSSGFYILKISSENMSQQTLRFSKE